MSDYTTLVSLLPTISLILLAVAYFFGKLTSEGEIYEKDKDAHTIDGLFFMLYYAYAPLIAIVYFEILLQTTSATRLITIALGLLLFIQNVLYLILVITLKLTVPATKFFLSRETRISVSIAKLIFAFYEKPYLRMLVASFNIISVYIFIKVYLSMHVPILDIDVPADYGIWKFIILSVLVTLLTYVPTRLIHQSVDFTPPNIVIQMDDATLIEGKLWKWGKFIEVHTKEKILYLNENNIKSVEYPHLPKKENIKI